MPLQRPRWRVPPLHRRVAEHGGNGCAGGHYRPFVGSSRSVAGKVVLVTGAASGMGRAIADVFGAEDAKVAATDRNADDLPGTANWRLDVTDQDAITDVVGEIVRTLGPIDVLVNCAGVSVPAPIDAETYDDAWGVTLAVNLVGYVQMIRTCLPHLTREPRRPHREHRLDRGSRRHALSEPLHREQARRGRPHALAGL